MRTEYLTGRPNSIGCQKIVTFMCRSQPADLQTSWPDLSYGAIPTTSKINLNSKVPSSWLVLELNFYF